MATISKGTSYGATEQITNTKLHALVDDASISDIANADISATAAIADTKLAQISTAEKVSAAAITSMTSLPSGAGVIPDANLPVYAYKKTVTWKVLAHDTEVTTGDGKDYWRIPLELNGMDLVDVSAHVYTTSTSGLPEIQIYNVTGTADMLSTAITIDENENDSDDATTPPVIDTDEDDIATQDILRVDVDTAGTGTKGLELTLTFATP